MTPNSTRLDSGPTSVRGVSQRPPPSSTPTSARRPTTENVSALLGSSRYRALADDALKDEDNAAWVLTLDADARRAWLERIHWIRLVDRLAENERFEPEQRRFRRFLDGWRLLCTEGFVDPSGPFARELDGIRQTWLLPGSGGDHAPQSVCARRATASWDAYLQALADYHAPDVRVRTVHEHDEMLWRLSGRLFQLVPFLRGDLWEAAGEFGRLDQFFNNLRDIQEDAEHGICYLPADLLERFGVSRAEIISGRCVDRPGYQALMHHWLDEHLPMLRARAARFIKAEGLHPSLELMLAWTLKRHERIERVLRAVEFDFRRFPSRYWAEVRRDLLAYRAATRTADAALQPA